MKKNCLILSFLLLSFFFACATAGQKYISLNYTGDIAGTKQGSIGISTFKDARTDFPKGYVGHRVLLDNSQETYFVNTMDLSKSMTQAIVSFLEQKGYTPALVRDWELTPDGVAAASQGMPYLVAGTIHKFECQAQKRGGHTSMVLDIHFTLNLGITAKTALKTIPVSYSLEKTVLTFSQEKLETFVNDSIAEILEKALVIEG